MRKNLVSLIVTSALIFGSMPIIVSAHEGNMNLNGANISNSAENAKEGIHLNLNGTDVADSAALNLNGSIYVSVHTFANYYSAKVDWNESTKVLKLNGKEVSNTYGEPRLTNTLTAPIRAISEAVGEDHFAIGWEPKSSTVNVAILPKGTIKLTPPIPQMGEHWANPKDMPLGPIYGVYNGKLVFFEYMPAKDLDKTIHDVPGNLVPLPTKIDHFDIDWNPKGHEGYEVPHYDMHLYFISREEQDRMGVRMVNLTNSKGDSVGHAVLVDTPAGLSLEANVLGLTPGKHGFHIHQFSITGNDFKTAGSHFNPEGKKHGQNNPDGAHLGDLPNLEVKADGKGELKIMLKGITLEPGKSNSLLGKSLVIHAAEDDGKTDPSGNSGDRIAGGNIVE